MLADAINTDGMVRGLLLFLGIVIASTLAAALLIKFVRQVCLPAEPKKK